EGQAEQTVDHRRHTGQVDYALTDHAHPESIPGKLVEVDGGADPDRECHEDRTDTEVQGAENGRQDAALGHGIAWHLGQEFPVDRGNAIDRNEQQEANQRQQVDHGRYAQYPKGDLLDTSSATITTF